MNNIDASTKVLTSEGFKPVSELDNSKPLVVEDCVIKVTELADYNLVMDRKPIKMWTKGVEVEAEAIQQLRNISRMPFIYKHVAAMADCHVGKGATIGSVIATKGAIIPAAVGVDLGCGMNYVRTNLKAHHLPDNLHELRLSIEARIPHGRTNNGQKGDRGAWGNAPDEITITWNSLLSKRYAEIVAKHPKASAYNTHSHLGTLGTGNHFVEIVIDEQDHVGVLLHSGSRGAGNKIGSYFIERAKLEMEKYYIDQYLSDQDLSYLVEHTEIYDDYVEAVLWAQDYAAANRQIMMDAVLHALFNHLNWPEPMVLEEVVSCHHNYISKENHFGQNVIVTRKGAVRAREGDLGIIPGSMGTGSFIVRGLGNKESFCSCSHGAGRKMSRGAANRQISLEEHAMAMKGIECRLDKDVLDESPAAYKDINAVMEAQKSLVEIVHTLRQVLNVKG